MVKLMKCGEDEEKGMGFTALDPMEASNDFPPDYDGYLTQCILTMKLLTLYFSGSPTGSEDQPIEFVRACYTTDSKEEKVVAGPTWQADASDRISNRDSNYNFALGCFLKFYASNETEFSGPPDSNVGTCAEYLRNNSVLKRIFGEPDLGRLLKIKQTRPNPQIQFHLEFKKELEVVVHYNEQLIHSPQALSELADRLMGRPIWPTMEVLVGSEKILGQTFDHVQSWRILNQPGPGVRVKVTPLPETYCCVFGIEFTVGEQGQTKDEDPKVQRLGDEITHSGENEVVLLPKENQAYPLTQPSWNCLLLISSKTPLTEKSLSVLQTQLESGLSKIPNFPYADALNFAFHFSSPPLFIPAADRFKEKGFSTNPKDWISTPQEPEMTLEEFKADLMGRMTSALGNCQHSDELNYGGSVFYTQIEE